jgi:hypothetical protein
MKIFKDYRGRSFRLTDERLEHFENHHPEMAAQLNRISETLKAPDKIIQSKTDKTVELFYNHYKITPVSEKMLCVVVKTSRDDNFVITAYYTDTIKRGKILWEKK